MHARSVARRHHGIQHLQSKNPRIQFSAGPVFANVLLVDEINRTTPRTQSELLEAMAEHQVTVDNSRHLLSDTFFVIATQNPIEHHGTYPLPEAQLTIAMKLSIGYPAKEYAVAMLESALGHCCDPPGPPEPIVEPGELHPLQEQVSRRRFSRGYGTILSNCPSPRGRIRA